MPVTETDSVVVLCPKCRGNGRIYDSVFTEPNSCHFCDGLGRIVKITQVEWCKLSSDFEAEEVPATLTCGPIREPRYMKSIRDTPKTKEELVADTLRGDTHENP
jgi:RecJ-like exonuclease